MDRKPLERILGLSTDWIDEPDGTVTIETYQDVGPILEANKRQYNDHGDARTPGKMNFDGLHKVASLPETVLQQWIREDPEVARKPKLLFQKLNDPEFRYFKTTPVRL